MKYGEAKLKLALALKAPEVPRGFLGYLAIRMNEVVILDQPSINTAQTVIATLRPEQIWEGLNVKEWHQLTVSIMYAYERIESCKKLPKRSRQKPVKRCSTFFTPHRPGGNG